MYVGRTLDQLKSLAYEKWTIEELAYHRDTMQRFAGYLNADGQKILQDVEAEIDSRGGLPDYGSGDYDHPSSLHYD